MALKLSPSFFEFLKNKGVLVKTKIMKIPFFHKTMLFLANILGTVEIAMTFRDILNSTLSTNHRILAFSKFFFCSRRNANFIFIRKFI